MHPRRDRGLCCKQAMSLHVMDALPDVQVTAPPVRLGTHNRAVLYLPALCVSMPMHCSAPVTSLCICRAPGP